MVKLSCSEYAMNGSDQAVVLDGGRGSVSLLGVLWNTVFTEIGPKTRWMEEDLY